MVRWAEPALPKTAPAHRPPAHVLPCPQTLLLGSRVATRQLYCRSEKGSGPGRAEGEVGCVAGGLRGRMGRWVSSHHLL